MCKINKWYQDFLLWRIGTRLAVLMFILLFLVSIRGSVIAQSMDTFYIEETGMWIQGDFYQFYKTFDNPDLIFGNPITNQYVDSLTGNTTQYFENVRLDLIPGESGSTTRLAPLGELVYEDTNNQANNLPWSGSCKKIIPGGFDVCYAFIEFYEANQGRALFGTPISPIEIRDHHFVQYFQNVRLEWQPENESGARIAVSSLGKYYFETMVGSIPEGEQDSHNSIVTTEKVKLRSNAFVASSLLPSNSQQTLYITALDQYYHPVEGATAGVTVHLPKKDIFYRPPVTDVNGISILTFTVQEVSIDEIITIDVTTSYQGVEEKSSTWFRIY